MILYMITYLYTGMRIQQHYDDYLLCFFGKVYYLFDVSRVACFFMMECVQKFIEKSWVFFMFFILWSRKFYYFFNFNLWSLNPQYKTDNSIVSLLNSIYFSTHTKKPTITILGLILTKCLPELLRHEKSVSQWSFSFYFRKENLGIWTNELKSLEILRN